jgi:hypothetical protein
MFVSAETVLRRDIAGVRIRLRRLIRDGRLSEASHAAYAGGMDQVLRVGPFGDRPGASRLVRVSFADPAYRGDEMAVPLRWETRGRAAGLFPVLDADITVSPADPEGTRIVLTGCYRPPLGAVGAGLDRVLMNKVAAMTVESLLARVASAIDELAGTEEEVSQVGGR